MTWLGNLLRKPPINTNSEQERPLITRIHAKNRVGPIFSILLPALGSIRVIRGQNLLLLMSCPYARESFWSWCSFVFGRKTLTPARHTATRSTPHSPLAYAKEIHFQICLF